MPVRENKSVCARKLKSMAKLISPPFPGFLVMVHAER
jgi:hypothetical protein